MYFEVHADMYEAIQREKRLKKWNRAWKVRLIEGMNPEWKDLSAEAVPIAARAGDMVLWHAALPHGASANRGTRPRMVQYIAWYPPERSDQRPWV